MAPGNRRGGGVVLLLLSACFLALAPAPQKTAVGFLWGVACGDASTGSAVLWTRADRPTTLVPEVDTRPDLATARRLEPVEARPGTDLTAKTLATDLAAGTRYYYRFLAPDGAVSPIGTCETAYAPDQRAPLTFGFSGDVDWRWKPYPLLHGLNREPLDFFVFLGDLMYEWMAVDESTVAESLDDYRLRYRDNREPRPACPACRRCKRLTAASATTRSSTTTSWASRSPTRARHHSTTVVPPWPMASMPP